MAFELIDSRTQLPFFSVLDGHTIDSTLLSRLYRDTSRLDERSAAFFRRKTLFADTQVGLQVEGAFELLSIMKIRPVTSKDKTPYRTSEQIYSFQANERLHRTSHLVAPGFGLYIPQLNLIVRHLGPSAKI